ncbi:MAG: hypothetical protein Q4B50_02455, partial [Bacillota bacterium]|nr:hypothetical protein [Bacillota bacterium]
MPQQYSIGKAIRDGRSTFKKEKPPAIYKCIRRKTSQRSRPRGACGEKQLSNTAQASECGRPKIIPFFAKHNASTQQKQNQTSKKITIYIYYIKQQTLCQTKIISFIKLKQSYIIILFTILFL